MVHDITKILMDRDGISKKDATARINECKRRLNDEALAAGDYELATEIIEDELGLEPDYMTDLIDEPITTNKKGRVIDMETTLIRANRVAVKANGDNFVADFYRTHKAVGSIHSENTDWQAPEDATNKTSARESFRQWAIANCKEWNIDWKPQDMRSDGNVRKARYTSDDELVEDAMNMIIPEMKALTEKCKYDITWCGVNHEDIIPVKFTGTGRDLSTMGITDGKYDKSGNWAWAEIHFMVTVKYKKDELYLPVNMQLVSGQLKKSGIGITEFNTRVKDEIISAGLATESELDPPKEPKKKESKKDNVKVDTNTETVVEQPKEEQEEVVKEEIKEEVKEEVQPVEQPKKKRVRRAKKNVDAE